MHYTKIHFKDYAADTSHLSLLEHGVYFQMMRLYYTNEKPLPLDADKIARFIGVKNAEERTAVDNVLEEFFTEGEDGWHQKRMDAEIHKYHHRKTVNAETGKLGGRPPKPKDNRTETESVSNQNPQGTLTTNHKPLTNKKTKNTCAADAAPEGFQTFWNVWPKSSRKVARAACLGKWRSMGLEPLTSQIVSRVEVAKQSKAWLEGFDPAPLTYLRQRRWEDDAGPADDPFKGVLGMGQ